VEQPLCLISEGVPSRVRNAIGSSKVMIMVFLGGEGLMCVETLDLRKTVTQDHFITFGPSDLKTHAQTFYRRKHPIN
jgi:hypothetical protein